MKMLPVIACAAILVGFCLPAKKQLPGNWTCESELYDMKPNDTLNFTRARGTGDLYQWGGALCGIGFDNNNGFWESHNVLCSSESDPVRYHDEKWTLHENILTISSNEREMEWKIIRLSRKELRVVVTKMNAKNE